MNVLYLNNSGSRWIFLNKNGKKPKVKIHDKGDIVRTAIEFRSFGNFASVLYSFKGKKIESINYSLIE